MEVGRGCGYQTLDIILSHHNESVHGCKCSYFFVNLFLTWYNVISKSPLKFAIVFFSCSRIEFEVGGGVATKLWISSCLITMNMCMVVNAPISYKSPLKFARVFSCSWTELEVGRECGHQILDINLSHHNESVQG